MSQIRMEQISAMNISFQFYSLEYFLESVARIGFQSVDLWTGYPTCCWTRTTRPSAGRSGRGATTWALR